MVDRDLDRSYLINESGNIDQTYRAQTDHSKEHKQNQHKNEVGPPDNPKKKKKG